MLTTCCTLGSIIEIIVTKENVINGIFFQDEEMRCMYDRFPEILFVDATYKLNDLRMPLSLVPRLSGGGEREPGNHCLRMCLISQHSGNSVFLWDTFRISLACAVIKQRATLC